MSEESSLRTTKRHPLLAGLLSLVSPGLGQVYCGRIRRGLVFIAVTVTAVPLYFQVLTRLSPPTTSALLAVLGAYALTTLIPLVDAIRLARRTRRDYQRKEYNHWAVYGLLWLVSTGGSLGYALHARDKCIEAFWVPHASMYPTILPGDRLLANKAAYRATDPQRGDLVIFTPLHQRQVKWIKRVIALAGDTVEIKQGQVFVNDKAFERKALPDWTLATLKAQYPEGSRKRQLINGMIYEESNGRTTYTILSSGRTTNTICQRGQGDEASVDLSNVPKTTIPKHHCYVLGDFRDNSYDSRLFGPIPLATIVGRADYLFWPVKSWSRFGPIGGLHRRNLDR